MISRRERPERDRRIPVVVYAIVLLICACVPLAIVLTLGHWSLALADPFPGTPLQCLDVDAVAEIRSDPQLLSDVYDRCRSEFAKRLDGFELGDDDLRAAFAVMAAHAMAPYGNSTVFDLPTLLAEPVLDCDNYAALAGHFVRILLPGRPHVFAVAGFDGGAVGNHAQVFLSLQRGRQLLADPTIGLIADIGFNDLLRGKKLAAESVVVMHMHKDKDIDGFGNRVYQALVAGSYEPSDLLYYIDGLDRFINYSERIAPFFSQKSIDIPRLLEFFPTPAATALGRDLQTLSEKSP
jgi:hypothetical protein